MSILINKNTKIIVQGLTGRQGRGRGQPSGRQLRRSHDLYVGFLSGRRRSIEELAPSTASNAADPYITYSSAPKPLPEWSGKLWLVTHVDLHRTEKVQEMLGCIKAARG